MPPKTGSSKSLPPSSQKLNEKPKRAPKQKKQAHKASPATKKQEPRKPLLKACNGVGKNARRMKAPVMPSKSCYPLVMSNMVFTFDFQRTVNIAHVAAAFHGSRPPKFPAAIVALSTPVVTLIFFSTGQVVLSGARSEGDAAIAAWMAAVKMTTLTGNEHYVHNLRVQNVVGTCALGFPIDCGLLDRDFQMYTLHKPARISHVKFKAWAERRVMLVYPSGKLVVSGVKHPDQLRAISTSFDFRPYNANKPYRQLEPEYRKSSVRTAGKGETKSKSKAKAASRAASAK